MHAGEGGQRRQPSGKCKSNRKGDISQHLLEWLLPKGQETARMTSVTGEGKGRIGQGRLRQWRGSSGCERKDRRRQRPGESLRPRQQIQGGLGQPKGEHQSRERQPKSPTLGGSGCTLGPQPCSFTGWGLPGKSMSSAQKLRQAPRML